MGNASRLFNGNAEKTLYKNVTPTTEQRQYLQREWNDLATFLTERLASNGYPVSTWIQGSYKFGTLIKPVRLGEEYDVDLGVYFAWNPTANQATPTPTQLRVWVQAELHSYKRRHTQVQEILDPPKERCSRAVFVRQFHIDTPTYHLNPQNDERNLARLNGTWEHSDPKLLYLWFRDTVGTDNRELVRRLIRYLKGWSAVAFYNREQSRPSSILLTVLTAEEFVRLWGTQKVDIPDDDALTHIVRRIYERIEENPRVENPVDPEEDLNRITDEGWNDFFDSLRTLDASAQAAFSAVDEPTSALAWEEAFSYLMPLPETADEVEVEDNTGRALIVVPDIEIRVFARKGGALEATHRNHLPSVVVGKHLEFEILKPENLPKYSEITWTVRNDGDEAITLGDLGHSAKGIGLFSNSESTAYIGLHYMDCVIRANGIVFAVRRVSVAIDPKPVKRLPSPRKSYNKLRTRKGRRR